MAKGALNPITKSLDDSIVFGMILVGTLLGLTLMLPVVFMATPVVAGMICVAGIGPNNERMPCLPDDWQPGNTGGVVSPAINGPNIFDQMRQERALRKEKEKRLKAEIKRLHTKFKGISNRQSQVRQSLGRQLIRLSVDIKASLGDRASKSISPRSGTLLFGEAPNPVTGVFMQPLSVPSKTVISSEQLQKTAAVLKHSTPSSVEDQRFIANQAAAILMGQSSYLRVVLSGGGNVEQTSNTQEINRLVESLRITKDRFVNAKYFRAEASIKLRKDEAGIQAIIAKLEHTEEEEVIDKLRAEGEKIVARIEKTELKITQLDKQVIVDQAKIEKTTQKITVILR